MQTASLTTGMWAGFVATVYLSLFMIAKARLGLIPALNPIKDIVTVADWFGGARLPLWAGWFGHFVVGSIAWGAVYAVLQPALPGEPWVKGLIFGALAWLVMMVAFMPLAGQGLFAKKIGPFAVVASLVLHLVYGFVLGLAYAY